MAHAVVVDRSDQLNPCGRELDKCLGYARMDERDCRGFGATLHNTLRGFGIDLCLQSRDASAQTLGRPNRAIRDHWIDYTNWLSRRALSSLFLGL